MTPVSIPIGQYTPQRVQQVHLAKAVSIAICMKALSTWPLRRMISPSVALDLVGRDLLRVLAVGQVVEAAVGAQAAVRADLEPGAEPGLAGLLDEVPQGLGVDLQVVHLLVVLLAALVGQQAPAAARGSSPCSCCRGFLPAWRLPLALQFGNRLPVDALALHAPALDAVVHARAGRGWRRRARSATAWSAGWRPGRARRSGCERSATARCARRRSGPSGR